MYSVFIFWLKSCIDRKWNSSEMLFISWTHRLDGAENPSPTLPQGDNGQHIYFHQVLSCTSPVTRSLKRIQKEEEEKKGNEWTQSCSFCSGVSSVCGNFQRESHRANTSSREWDSKLTPGSTSHKWTELRKGEGSSCHQMTATTPPHASNGLWAMPAACGQGVSTVNLRTLGRRQVIHHFLSSVWPYNWPLRTRHQRLDVLWKAQFIEISRYMAAHSAVTLTSFSLLIPSYIRKSRFKCD